jgi:predicted site-specific integrase-resolvase
MTDIVHKEKEPVVYSLRRKRSLHRKRLMDVDKAANPDQLPPGTPIAVYSRVSSEEQVHGYSLDAQVNACKAFAAQRKWKIVKFYSDPGRSAKDDNRPDFARMIVSSQ